MVQILIQLCGGGHRFDLRYRIGGQRTKFGGEKAQKSLSFVLNDGLSTRAIQPGFFHFLHGSKFLSREQSIEASLLVVRKLEVGLDDVDQQ